MNKIVPCPQCNKEGESSEDDTELTCAFCGHCWIYSMESPEKRDNNELVKKYYSVSVNLIELLSDPKNKLSPADAGAVLLLTLGRLTARQTQIKECEVAWNFLLNDNTKCFFELGFDNQRVNDQKEGRKRFFKCKGCKNGIGIEFIDGYPPYYPPGSVGHTKPLKFINIPNTVTCTLYKQLSAQQYLEIHADAEPVEEPTSFEPVLD